MSIVIHIACGVVGRSLYSDVMTQVKYLACLDMLLQNIDSDTLNKQNQGGASAMHHACRIGNHIVVKKLLNLPEINFTLYDDYGDTPLFDIIYASKHIFDSLKTTGITCHHKVWGLTCF